MKKTAKRKEIYVEPSIPMEALAWPTEPEPLPVDVRNELEGKPFGALYVGWWMNPYFNTFDSTNGRVGQGCSSGYSHSTSSTVKTSTQQVGRFYATKKDAVLALRWAWCRMFAKALHKAAQLDTAE